MVGNIFQRKYAFIFLSLPSCLHVMAVLFFSSCDWLDCKLPSDRPYYHEQMVSRDLCSNAHKHVWPISNVLSHSLRDKKQKIDKNGIHVWPIWTFLRQRFWLQAKASRALMGDWRGKQWKWILLPPTVPFYWTPERKCETQANRQNLRNMSKQFVMWMGSISIFWITFSLLQFSTCQPADGYQIIARVIHFHIFSAEKNSFSRTGLLFHHIFIIREPLVGLFSLPWRGI